MVRRNLLGFKKEATDVTMKESNHLSGRSTHSDAPENRSEYQNIIHQYSQEKEKSNKKLAYYNLRSAHHD